MKKFFCVLWLSIMISQVLSTEIDNSVFDDDYIFEDSLENLIQEATKKTGTENIDRKKSEFNEAKKDESTDTIETLFTKDKTEEEKTTETIIQPERQKVRSAGKTYQKNQTTQEYESVTNSTFTIKRIKMYNSLRTKQIKIKSSIRGKTDKIEICTMSSPLKLQRIFIITTKGAIYTKKDIEITRNTPYILNLANQRISKIIVVYDAAEKITSKEYFYIIGIDEK